MQNKPEFETTNRSMSFCEETVRSSTSKFNADEKKEKEMMISAAKEPAYVC